MAMMAYTMMQRLYDTKELVDRENFTVKMLLSDLANFVDGVAKNLNDGVHRDKAEQLNAYRVSMYRFLDSSRDGLSLSDEDYDFVAEAIEDALNV